MSDAICDSSVRSEPDAILLRRFAVGRSEAAFAELVRRHGPLVWGVCRRRLERREDAEDAFQVTFLRLAIKAGTIRTPAALPGWLHRTACRAALRVASVTPVESTHEPLDDGLGAFVEVARREATTAIDEELVRLPNRYRDAVILFHLQGLDRREVAERLGLSETAVKGLLIRGRSLLRTRLARRGVALPLLLPLAVDPVPAEATASASRLAFSVARAGLSPVDLVSFPSQGLQLMMTWLSSKTAVATIAAAICLSLFVVTREEATAKNSGNASDRFENTALETTAPGTSERNVDIVAFADPNQAVDEKPSYPAAGQAGAASTGPLELAANPREQLIRDALDESTSLEFLQTPLREALAFLADRHKINVLIDELALNVEGVSIDDSVDVVLQDVSLRSGLEILLEPFELTYVIEDDVMKITTVARAEGKISTRAFDAASLVGPEGTAADAALVLTQMLEPLEKGSETSQPRIVPFRDRIFVTANAIDQKRVEKLLRLMTAGPGRVRAAAGGGQSRSTAPVVKVFRLENADAAESARTLEVLLKETESNGGPGKLRISVDARTNSLIVVGDEELLEIAEALLLRLDETGTPSARQSGSNERTAP